MARTDNENREYCRHIADELEAAASGELFKCEHCGELVSIADYDEETAEAIENGDYMKPLCCNGDQDGETYYHPYAVIDWVDDNTLDYDYTITCDGDYKGVSILVTLGGPNVYVDTIYGAVRLYWGVDREEYPLDGDAVDELNAYFQELYNMVRGC